MNKWTQIKMMSLGILLFIFKFCIADPTPIVMWHGMGDTCCAVYSLGHFRSYLQAVIPGVYVTSIRIGNSFIEDMENGYFLNPNGQVQYVCDKLAVDPKLHKGFNAIGFSQGSQFLRAVVQRCGHKIGPVKNLISLGGQHQGVYGLPNCAALQHRACDYIRKLLNHAAYQRWVQFSLVQATYWHDPLNETLYRQRSEFLADINNELRVNDTYANNLNSLEHFVMVKFEDDTIVQPRETEWFGFYAPGQATQIITLQDSDIYKQDRLGLKKMDEAGKLVFLSLPGQHLSISEEWFTENIVKRYLL